MGGSVTVTDMLESPIMQDLFPNLYSHLKLVSSTPIRNMATIAGNLVNASPIGDMTIWLLALDATIALTHTAEREIALRNFYLGYKTLDKTEDEFITKSRFPKPNESYHFNFEKVSKRRYLDIATVNTAIQLQIADGLIVQAHAAAGGVAPVPLYLKQTSAFLTGKKVPTTKDDFSNLYAVLQKEISPISDVRGSETYKRLLLQQLFRAHFENLFPTT
jgi:xanthine dehydrogenase small subunit